jgi:hypothetical protein
VVSASHGIKSNDTLRSTTKVVGGGSGAAALRLTSPPFDGVIDDTP